MQYAQQDLGEQAPEGAAKRQEEAIEALERAEDEIRRILAQLKREQQDEMLQALEVRFQRMLHREKNILRQTEERERERLASESQAHTRVRMLAIGKIANELNLSREALIRAREAHAEYLSVLRRPDGSGDQPESVD